MTVVQLRYLAEYNELLVQFRINCSAFNQSDASIYRSSIIIKKISYFQVMYPVQKSNSTCTQVLVKKNLITYQFTSLIVLVSYAVAYMYLYLLHIISSPQNYNF